MDHGKEDRPRRSERFARRLMRSVISAAGVCTVLLVLASCERAKSRLDREVDRLCAIDGGVHIYETVRLPKENFGPDGEVFPQFKGRPTTGGGYGAEYRTVFLKETIHEGDPALTRQRTQIVRVRDGKVLGEIISYARSGGDFYGPWEPSVHACNLGITPNNFDRRIFLVQEE